MNRLTALSSLVFWAAAFSPAIGQDRTEVTGWAIAGGLRSPEVLPPVRDGYDPLDRGPEPPEPAMPPIPDGPVRPGPDTPESRAIDVDQQQFFTGQFRYFRNRAVTPSGAARSTVGEPSVGIVQDTVFMTGGSYAARSEDNGETWTHVSPFSFLGPLDGGFCCNQRVYYDATHDITIWLLQYAFSSTTQRGSVRFAVANGRADLRDDSAAAWTVYRLDPGLMGFGTGNWFDVADIATTGDKLFVSANVHSGADQSFQGAAVGIMDLADMAANQSVAWSFLTSATLLGDSYRFAEGGAVDRIYFASLRNTSSHYVYRLTNGGSLSRVTRDVGTYSNATASCPGPDGRDWCGAVTGRFRGSFGSDNEVGWMLTSAAQTSSNRALPYTRVCRFTADENRSLIAEHDIWSSTLTFAYCTGRSNSSADVGLVMAIGSPTSYVQSAATMVDQYQAWGALTVFSMSAGSHGPDTNRWGDYFDVHAHSGHPGTFVATGMEQNGGATGADNRPRFVWFGRDDDEPTWVNLTVQHAGAPGSVPITMDVTDLDGDRDGSTTLVRRFAPNQGYVLTAPASTTVRGIVYRFCNWLHRATPGGSWIRQPAGERTLVRSSIGNLDDVCEAVYAASRTINIGSVNPRSGIPITVTPDDYGGNGSARTPFARVYKIGVDVTLTAAATNGSQPFKQWLLDGVAQRLHDRVLRIRTIASPTAQAAEAEYYTHVHGTIRPFGTGCPAASGRVPSHSSRSHPDIGNRVAYDVTGAPLRVAGAVQLGFSNRQWLNFSLPLRLGFLGFDPLCTLYVSPDISLPVVIDSAGTASTTVDLNGLSTSLIGRHYYTQVLVLDPRSRFSIPVICSNALDTTIGGNR